MKQARFSIDQGHPEAVQSADASAQPLSSLSGSDSAGVPAVTTSNGGQTPGLSNSSATATGATSSNPSSSSLGGSGVDGGRPLLSLAPNHRNMTVSSSNVHTGKRKEQGSNGASGAGTMDPNKRKERNAREKERSCRIARQIDDLRTLLSRGGVIVSKGTKSSVLAEAANYINILQQQQAQWEM